MFPQNLESRKGWVSLFPSIAKMHFYKYVRQILYNFMKTNLLSSTNGPIFVLVTGILGLLTFQRWGCSRQMLHFQENTYISIYISTLKGSTNCIMELKG